MARQKPIEFITPPNILKIKVGGGHGGTDKAAIERANKALADLKDQFAGWLDKEVDSLTKAKEKIRKEGLTKETAKELHSFAFDLKGLGTTYDFPLVTKIAGLLCDLIDRSPDPAKIPIALLDGHVDAIRVVVREQIKKPDDPLGTRLVSELEMTVKAFFAKLAPKG